MKPCLVRIFGGLLLLLAAAGAFVWFYWLAPYRHWTSDLWMHDHSSEIQWIELQKLLPRQMIWSRDWSCQPLHLAGHFVGMWGDKESVAWLIKQMKRGRNLWECSDGHLYCALPYITNQGDKWEEEAWISWWTTNSHKTQLEWIRDGFKERSFEFRQPLTTNDVLNLLKLAFPPKATKSIAASHPSPERLRYNAKRWLRDAGFRTWNFDFRLLDSQPAEERGDYIRALIGYASWLVEAAESPGRLTIPGAVNDAWDREEVEAGEYWIYREPCRWLPHLVVVALAGLGQQFSF